MVTREDFEIYEFVRDGQKWYGFKVDYIGVYSAPTKELILKKQAEVRKKVKAKLAWVEKENQKYYARLAKEERRRAFLLQQAKKEEQKTLEQLERITVQEKKQRSEKVYDLMAQGKSDEDILLTTDVPHRVVSRLRHEFRTKKRTSARERM